ncbi:MAG TPA: mechanosensitive ion channel family protein [Planctomycetota bacterium]|jgi:small-conductance mechanosensitive channel|nr:mechanosensitive ion channel family protein [Planctomycetota bacterium]
MLSFPIRVPPAFSSAEVLDRLRPWLAPLGILVGATLAGTVVKAILLRRLRVFFARTETRLDDLLLDALARHLPLWFLLAGIGAGVQASPLPLNHQDLIHKVLRGGFILSVTLALSRFGAGAVTGYAPRLSTSATLAANLVKVAVFGIGFLALVGSTVGWRHIAPILTALGVGSLAVALALQDTLSNLFAGIHIVASRMVAAGDWIRLDSGQEGEVVEVGWRFTRVRDGAGNDILVPNSKLAQAIVVNYQKPTPEIRIPVEVGVAYGSDLAKVERVTLEVAREVQETVTGAVAAFPPAVRFHTFSDSAIALSVVLAARSLPDRALLVHEFLKRLHARYGTEGIEIPFPQRVVHLHDARA